MTFTALIVIFALGGILFLFAAIRRLRRRRALGGVLNGAAALVLILLSVCAALIAGNLRTYQRLSFEQPAGELQLTRTGEREYNAALTYPSGEHANFALLGCYLGSDYVDLLLGRYSLALDFLNKLEMPLSVAWIIDFALSCKGVCRIAVD